MGLGAGTARIKTKRTKADIEQNLRDIEPEEGKAKYFIEIGGKKYPIKQTLSQTLNFAKVAFIS